MSSALLKVGVSTEEGRAEVLAFKTWLQENLGVIKFDIKPDKLAPLKVQVDTNALGKTLTDSLRAKYKIEIDSADLSTKIRSAVTAATAGEYRIGIDSSYLINEVRRAVGAGVASAQAVSISASVNTDGLKVGDGLILGDQFGRDFSKAVGVHILQVRDDISTVVSKPIGISLDTTESLSALRLGLRESISEATRGSADGYDIRIDNSALTNSVAAAIRAGIAQAGTISIPVSAPAVPPGVVQPGAPSLPPATVAAVAPVGQQNNQALSPPVIAELFRQSLVPLINRLDRITTTDGEKKIAGGTRRAAVGKSVKDAETGLTLRQSESLNPDEAASLSRRIERENEEKKLAAEAQKRIAEETDAIKRAALERDEAYRQYNLAQEKQSAKERDRAFKAAETTSNAQKASAWRIADKERSDQLAKSRQQIKAYEDNQKEEQRVAAEAQKRIAAETDAIKRGVLERDEAYRQHNQAQQTQATKAKDNAFKLAEASAAEQKGSAWRIAAKERADQLNQAKAQIKLYEDNLDAQERLLKRQVRVAFQKAQLDAKSSYTGDGVRIKAVSDVVDKFGYDRVSGVLGHQAELYREKARLSAYSRDDRVLSGEDAARRNAMALAFQKAKSSASGEYTGLGTSISAAQQLATQFPREQVQEFLGKKQYLLDMQDSLVQYRKALGDTKAHADLVRDSHAKMARATWEAHSAARGLAGSLGAVWLTWGSTAPLVAAAAIGFGLRSVFTIGKDVQYQLAFVGALAGEMAPKIDAFGSSVRGSLILPKDAAEGMRALAQNGLSVTESLRALPDVLRLATVGEMNVADAALGATGVLSAFNLTIDSLGHVSDVFAKAAAMSNTSVNGMVEAMKQASTVSDQYGVSLEETAASLAVMAKRNISGTAAGTAFRNMMVELATPTDNAKRTIKALGLEFYDNNGKLKSFADLLSEVKNRTDLLNQKGKLEALNNIFGERGGKAANAILSDYELYGKTLDEIKTKSDGFTKSVVNLLNETTQGRMRGLFTDFQVSAVQAFEGASVSANGFIETLRKFVNTPNFANSISALANNVAAFSTAVVDNGGIITGALVVYGLYKVMIGGVQASIASLSASQAAKAATDAVATAAAGTNTVAIQAQAAAARGATVALVGMRVSAAALAATLTFGLSIVAAFALEWLVFSDHTDKATNAMNTNLLTLERQGEQLDTELQKLRQNNRELATRNSLMQQGMTFEEASKRSKELVQTQDNRTERQKLADQVDKSRGKVDSARTEAELIKGTVGVDNSRPYAYLAASTAESAAQAELDKAETALKRFDDNVAKQAAISRETTMGAILSTKAALTNEAREFNKSFEDFSRRTGYKGRDLKIAQGRDETNDAFKARLSSVKTEFESVKPTFTLPERGAASAASALRKAETRGLVEELKDQDQALKSSQEFRRQIDEYRFRASELGQPISAALAEAASIREVAQAQDAHTLAIKRLKDEEAKARKGGNEAEVQRIQNEIDNRTRLAEAMKLESTRRAELAKWKAEAVSRKDDRSFQDNLSRLSASDLEASIRRDEELRRSQEDVNRTASPSRRAYDDAYRETSKSYKPQVDDQARKLDQAKADLKAVEEMSKSLIEAGDAQAGTYDETLKIAKELVEEEQRRLDILVEQATVASQAAGEQARRQPTKDTDTLNLFTDIKTWTEVASAHLEKLQRDAIGNAEIMDQAFSISFQGMSSELNKFVTTGKFSFRGMLSYMLSEIAKFLVSRVVTQLIQIGLSMFGGSYSYNGGVGTTNAAGISGGRAGGGQVMANAMHRVNEKQPELYYDARTGNQYLMSGSGGGSVQNMKRVESGYQPAGQSSDGGSGGVIISVSVSVNSDGTSDTKVSKEGADADKGDSLARLLTNSVKAVIVEELRPGGILYGAR